MYIYIYLNLYLYIHIYTYIYIFLNIYIYINSYSNIIYHVLYINTILVNGAISRGLFVSHGAPSHSISLLLLAEQLPALM